MSRVSFYQGVLDKDSVKKLKEWGAERVEMYLCEDGQVVFLRAGDTDAIEGVCKKVFEKLIGKSQEGKSNFDSKNQDELEPISELELGEEL